MHKVLQQVHEILTAWCEGKIIQPMLSTESPVKDPGLPEEGAQTWNIRRRPSCLWLVLIGWGGGPEGPSGSGLEPQVLVYEGGGGPPPLPPIFVAQIFIMIRDVGKISLPPLRKSWIRTWSPRCEPSSAQACTPLGLIRNWKWRNLSLTFAVF